MPDKKWSSLCAEILPPNGWEAGRLIEGQKRDGKGNTQTLIPFMMARQKGMFARPAVTWAVQGSKVSTREEALRFLCRGHRSSDILTQQQTSFQWKTYCPVPQKLLRNQVTLRKARQRGSTKQSDSLVKLGWKADSWSLLPLCHTPHHGGLAAWAEEEARDGAERKGMGKNPKKVKPNSKLYSANQFFDQKNSK